MATDRIHYLLQRFFHHECTPEESEELALWIDSLQNDEEWKLRLRAIWNNYEPDDKVDPLKADLILKEILDENRHQFQPVRNKQPHYTSLPARMMRWSVVAAAVVGVLIVLSVIYLTKKPVVPANTLTAHHTVRQADIKPGGYKAILTLSNGSKVILDSVSNGSLAQQGSTRIVKMNAGLLTYNHNGHGQTGNGGNQSLPGKPTEMQYNTISTPRGGQYQVRLPDGSKVWLNAASSLHFSTSFTGKERQVEVSGEAYFEIAKNASMPFIVHIMSPQGQEEGTIKVLGTHFNVNAYGDESAVKTTLLEGAVSVLNTNRFIRLSPGEQAVMHNTDPIKIMENINLHETIAWKNGLFDFEGNDIQSVMREIARWYNVDVRYENISPAHFMGSISRNANISEVLRMLELTGAVHFKIEGRVITVM